MHGDDGQIWETFGGHFFAKPSMDPPNTRKWPFPLPCSPQARRREFLEVPSRLERCCQRASLIVRRPRWIHRNRSLSKDDGSRIRWSHFSFPMQYLRKFYCGLFRHRIDYLRNKSSELIMCPPFLAEANFEFWTDYVKERYCHRSFPVLCSWLWWVVFSISLSTANTWTFFRPSYIALLID